MKNLEKDYTIIFQSTLPRGERLIQSCMIVIILQFQSTLPRGERPGAVPYIPTSSTYFNPRSREGSDYTDWGLRGVAKIFQSTLPRGERPQRIQFGRLLRTFQSTLPRGERLLSSDPLLVSDSISIHAPARGATSRVIYSAIRCFYFNPRSREGSDAGLTVATALINKISIHAPARGATSSFQLVLPCSFISIHAPARGATNPYSVILLNQSLFQSTLPRGERRIRTTGTCTGYEISIHAPARGATK